MKKGLAKTEAKAPTQRVARVAPATGRLGGRCWAAGSALGVPLLLQSPVTVGFPRPLGHEKDLHFQYGDT